jgi:hypothetical protein
MTVTLFCDGCFKKCRADDNMIDKELYGTKLSFCQAECFEKFTRDFQKVLARVDPDERHRHCNCNGCYSIYYTKPKYVMVLTPGDEYYKCKAFAKALAYYYFDREIIPNYYIHHNMINISDDTVRSLIEARENKRLIRRHKRDKEITAALEDELARSNLENNELMDAIFALDKVLSI